jgi:hypothetical protein
MKLWRPWLRCVKGVWSLVRNRSSIMTPRPTWITCRHIMDGSAKIATVRPNGLCVCEKCAEYVNLMETDQVHIVEHDRLIGILEDVETVHGIENMKETS